MTNDRTNTGAKVFLKSLSAAEEGREWRLIRFVVAYTGWLILFFVCGVCLISPEVRARGSWILGWLSFCLAYLAALEVLSRTKEKLYETFLFRMVRIQVVMSLGSALLWMTGGAESHFWFVYLWPLFASALYFPWGVMWGICIEVAVLYFLASLVAAGGLALINVALLLTNLAVLLVFTVVFRYLVESVRKYQVTERALGYSDLLQQIQKDVDAAINLQEVLDRILQRAVDLVGARDGSLMLMEEDGKLHFHARVGGLFPEDKAKRTFMPGAPDEGIAGWVVRNRKPYVCQDTKTDTQFVDISTGGVPIRSLVSVPIISHGVVLGVINVDSSEPNRFSVADVELLVALANQVAVAIERAELLESLKQIGEKTLGGAEDIHQHIVDVVHRLTRCPVSMWRVDETGHQTRIVASRNISAKYVQEARLDLDHSVTGKAIRERRIIQVLDIQANPDFQNKEEAAREGWQSMLVVPLLAGPERAVGTLSIYSMIKREEFTPWELDLLRAFASQAGVAIQNADLIQELVVLNEIGRAVSVLDVEAIAHLVYDKTSQFMDTANFFLCLYDKTREELNFKIWMCGGQPLEPFASELSGLTSWIVQKKKSLLITDWDEEESRFPVKAGIVTERQRSWLGVPLLVGEEVIGVISVQSPEPYAFNRDTQRLLETIASQAATAIQNARHYEDLQRRAKGLEMLNRVAGRISISLNRQEIFQTVVEAIRTTLETTHCTLFILDDSGVLVPQATDGVPFELIKKRRFRSGEGLAGWVAQEGQSALVPDANEDPRFLPGMTAKPGTPRSMVLAPLRVEGKAIGVISADQDQVDAFDANDQQLLETLAVQAGIAIHNADLFEKERRRAGAMDLVRRIGARISGTLDLQEILALIVEGAMQLTRTESGVIHLVDRSKPAVIHSYEFPEDFGHPSSRFSEKKGLTWTVVSKGQIIAVSDIAEDDRVNPDMVDKRVKALVGVPLTVEGETIGAFFLNDSEPREFTEYEEELLNTLAHQAAIAIENARLYERLDYLAKRKAKDLQAASEVGQHLTAGIRLNEPEVVELIYDQASRVMDTDNMYIALYDEATDTVWFGLAFLEGEPVDVETKEGWQPRGAGKGRTEWIIRHREPLVSNTKDESEAWYQDSEHKEYIGQPFASWIGVPMIVGERVLGVLATYHATQEYVYDEDDLQVLSLMASQAAIALDNARLVRQLEQRVQEVEAFQELAEDLSKGLI